MYKIVIIRVIIKLMARLTIEEIINRGYITSVELAVGLMDGTYTLEDDIIKEGLTQVGVYDEVYNPEPEEIEETVTEEVTEETVTEESVDETATEESVNETVTELETEVAGETVTEEPVKETVDETVTEPETEVAEETVTEEPVEETVTEEPVEDIEETVTEEPVEEPSTEEPVEETEETVTEEPTEETVTETTKDINKCSEILDKAVELDIVHKSGSWYSYNGAKLGQGKTTVIDTLSSNPELLGEIEAKVIEQTNNDISESKEALNK